MPTAPGQWGNALQEFHCPLPLSNVAVHDRSSTAHCPQSVRQFIAAVRLPTAHGHCGSALQEYRLLGNIPPPPSWWARALHECHCPLPPAGMALHYSSCPGHCPKAVWQ